MSDEQMYCYCFNPLKRVPGGYGCDKCGMFFLMKPEEIGLLPIAPDGQNDNVRR